MAGGAVGYEYDFGCEWADGEVAEDGCGMWGFVADFFEDRGFVKDATGTAEFQEVVCE